VAAPVKKPKKDQGGHFWDWLAGDEEEEKTPPPAVKKPEAAAPDQTATPPPTLAPLPPAPTPSPLVSQPVPSVKPAMSFPPPPPPIHSTNTPPPSAPPPVMAAPSPVLAPVAPESIGTISVTSLPPLDGGAVEVGEAQRVPLTDAAKMPPPPGVILPAPVVGVAPPSGAEGAIVSASPPSSVLPAKTLWAHIQYFENQQQALAFWEKFRKANPDFPVVRLRTTSALSALKRGDERVALRVGPFASGGFIRMLCDDVNAQDNSLFGNGMECGPVTALGASANAYAPRERTAQQVLSAARHAVEPSGAAPAAHASYWVQLGSYTSRSKAEAAWEEALTKNREVLGSLTHRITSPPQGSQGTPIFRLQVGSFHSPLAAGEVCSRIKTNLGNCLVVAR
jgi:hypothetical protein